MSSSSIAPEGSVSGDPNLPSDLREGYAEVGDQRLHYVEAGEGPLVVLLHGFPEFWYGWRQQIKPLADAGFSVVAPDTRGYNLSSKPEGFEALAEEANKEDLSASCTHWINCNPWSPNFTGVCCRICKDQTDARNWDCEVFSAFSQ